MNLYEAMYILNPELDEETLKKVVSVIETAIADNGGKIEDSKTEGKKQLAYPVQKKIQKNHLLIDFSIEPDKIDKLNNIFKLNENIFRVMITRKEAKKTNKTKEL